MGTFDDINLGDSPQLNLSFGDTGTKGTGSSFDFGSWGGSWGNTTSKWEINAADTGNTDIADTSKDTKDTSLDGGESGIWSFGSNKKNKKKTTTAGFEFALGAVDESKEDETSRTAEADNWGPFAPSGGKAKKDKKKSAFEDIGTEPDLSGIGTGLEEPTAAAEDSWTAWGTASSKKDKKKGKKGAGEETVSISPPPPVAPKEVSPDDGWGAFNNTKKNKKKSKNANAEEHIEEPLVVADPALEPEADNGWGSLNGKKDKRKGNKNLVEEQHQETEPGEKETNVGAGFGWGNFDTAKKDKKKVNANPFGMQVSESIVEKEPDPENDLSFDFGGKKGKKGKKGATEDFTKIEPAVTVAPEFELGMDDGWGAFGSKKDKKKGKKGTVEDATKSDKVNAIQALDLDPFDDSGWGSNTKNDKKGKKDLFSEGQEDPLATAEHEADAHTVGVDDDWTNSWGSADKKGKKGKKAGTAVEAQKLDKVAPPPPAEPEPSTFDSWGTATKAKKGKKGKNLDSDPPIVAVPDQPEENVDPFEVDFGGWGLSAKDKKKKEKEREKEKKDIETREKAEREEKEKEEKEQAEQDEKESAEKDKAKIKTKAGKKGKAIGTEISKTKDLMADSVPDFAPAAVEEEVSWGMWPGSAKKDKIKNGKNALPVVPPPVPTPPAQGLTPEPELELIPGLDDVEDDEWASLAPAKSKAKKDGNTASKSTKAGEAKTAKKSTKDKAEYSPTEPSKDDLRKKESPKDESAAKATKSFWGGMGTTSTAKSKIGKAKDAEKPKDLMGLEDLLDDEVIGITEEAAPTWTKKGFKTKGDSKLGSKDVGTKKSSDDALLEDLLEVGDEQLASVMDEVEGKKDDAWNFWGGSKKTGGKKADELPTEITKPAGANQKGSLKNNFSHLKKEKEPESAATPADEASQFQPPKASKSPAMSVAKSTTKSSVLQRVKDLEKEKDKGSGRAKEKTSEDTAEPPPPEIILEPHSKAESAPPKKSSAAGSKSKSSKTDSKKKAPSPPAAQEKDTSTVPGSFPGEGLDDDLLDLLDAPLAEKKPAKKPAKSIKEPKQESAMDTMGYFDLDPPVAEPLPTPPPEPVAAKPAKKERARVVKNEGASSWGFWGATPKKDVKKDVSSKDDAELPPPKPKEKKPAPGLSRSKSTKTAKEKDKEMERSSRSSGSDEKEKKLESRPSKSRGSSFGGFFGGPPPVRAKTVRRNSTAASKTASSRRPSVDVDVDVIGLPSPPAGGAPEMNSKAAKLMGTAKVDRKASTRGKQKAKGSATSNRISKD